jgi:putative ABC transport system permease protein
MLFKLSLGNIRRSLKDYTIYFFTLIIGVSIFYVFNAIGTQMAFIEIEDDSRSMTELLTTMLSGVSVFVAAVLGLLIVYASRFLMKRRNKEFALYMILGVSKGRISAILLTETIIIGLGSLAVGLIAGIGLSQLMSALVASLFEADMTDYRFTVSNDAILKTVIYFTVMYFVVMIFNSFVISRFKLIDLIQSGKKSEKIRLKNPLLCVIIFIISVTALIFAYYQTGWNYGNLNQQKLYLYIGIGALSTFLIFWSVAGMMLRVIMSAKKTYYRGLNSFTFRQLSSKVNTMVFSMTVICLMLFVTICTLSASFSIRNSMNANLQKLCPADVELYIQTENNPDILEIGNEYNFDISSYLKDYAHFGTYQDENFSFSDFCADSINTEDYGFLFTSDSPETIIKLSDYNALMKIYGKDTLSLNEDEFALLCNYNSMRNLRNDVLKSNGKITVFGKTLTSKYSNCQDGFIDLAVQPLNTGIFVVPDSVIDGQTAISDYVIGNYTADSKEDKKAIEKEFRSEWNTKILTNYDNLSISENGGYIELETKIDIANAAIGLGAIITFLGLYIGIVFLIACGAILALKELSESIDSIGRYELLRKIGAEEKDISKSLLHQTGIFFLMPLILACIHSIFGMKFATYFLEIFGTEKMILSITITAIIILLIYGGYFLITYFCGKGIIKGKGEKVN